MSAKDKTLFGLARAQRMAEEDANAKLMYRGIMGGPTPFYLNCPLDAIEDVARGLRAETDIRFLLARHVIVVGGDEWALDGDLALWCKAKAYAGELNHQGFLNEAQRQGELVYQRKEDMMASKYRVPVNGTEVKVTPAQFDAALNWAANTEENPDKPMSIRAVFPERDNWASGQRRCCDRLAEKGVLKRVGNGYILPPEARRHLERYRYQ